MTGIRVAAVTVPDGAGAAGETAPGPGSLAPASGAAAPVVGWGDAEPVPCGVSAARVVGSSSGAEAEEALVTCERVLAPASSTAPGAGARRGTSSTRPGEGATRGASSAPGAGTGAVAGSGAGSGRRGRSRPGGSAGRSSASGGVGARRGLLLAPPAP